MLTMQSDIEKALRQLKALTDPKQLNFAIAKALTQTAVEVQKELRRNMPSRFTIRRPWIVQGIRVERATKQNLEAVVYSRDDFMELQETGGTKNPRRRYLAIPTKAVRRTKTQMIAKADRPGALGERAEVVEYNGNKWIALKKARRGANKGGQLRLLYLLIPRAELKERLGLEKDGLKIAPERFGPLLEKALEEALRTAR